MTIWIEVAQKTDGIDVATCAIDGQTYTAASRSGATMKLARALTAAGVPDQPWEFGRSGAVAMRGPSLAAWADKTILEPDRGFISMGSFVANTRFPTRGDGKEQGEAGALVGVVRTEACEAVAATSDEVPP